MTRHGSVVPAAVSASASAGKVRPANASNAKVAARYLRNEGVIAVPTDTIYGLAAHAGRDGGVKRLWEIKGRPSDLPIGIAVHEVAAIGKYARVEHVPDGLLEALLPGPVTVVLPRHEESALAPSLNPGRTNVGVRVPEDDFLRAALLSGLDAELFDTAEYIGRDPCGSMWKRALQSTLSGTGVPVVVDEQDLDRIRRLHRTPR